MMSVEQSVEWELAAETEVLGENLPQFHFVHHKSHMTWPGLEPEPPWWEADDLPPELCHGHPVALQNTFWDGNSELNVISICHNND
jgi:hypothetical protein